VRLIVEADLDPVPGWGDTADDWQAFVQRHLSYAVAHYNPTVEIAEDQAAVEDATDALWAGDEAAS
jgi:hypothetical protein